MQDERRPYDLPPHGSRRRYRALGCRCVGCTRGPNHPSLPTELRWPYRWLDRKLGERVELWFTEEEIAEWKANGLEDFEADRVCLKMGVFPHEVFPGYTDAGLDSGVYP